MNPKPFWPQRHLWGTPQRHLWDTPKANLTRASHFRQQLRTCAAPPRPAAWLGAQVYSRAPSPGQRVCARAVMLRPLALAEAPRALALSN